MKLLIAPEVNRTSEIDTKTAHSVAWLLLALLIVGLAAAGLFLPEHTETAADLRFPGADYVYSGILRGGKPSGIGEAILDSGGVYSGGFEDGRFHGEGTFTASNGKVFTGVFNEGIPGSGELPYSDGVLSVNDDTYSITAKNGWKYTGAFGANGQYGEGVFTFKNGMEYTGDFAEGLADGEGVLTKDGGILYEGGFSKGLFSGEGCYRSPAGWVYTGFFKNGLPEGKGEFLDKEGKAHESVWKDGVMVSLD
ncbi:MAG: hypothetical protein LBR73_04045 [Oscillospiraceae bacterium]|nr:hypothetical protein [Oscillospiraceae bacterium]